MIRADSRRRSIADAPLPLVHVSDDGALSVRFQEGGRMRLPGGPLRSTKSLFYLALWGSLELGGKPVRSTGIVPGVSVRIAAGRGPVDDEEASRLAKRTWQAAYSRLGDWIANGPRASSTLGMSALDGLQIEFAWDGVKDLSPGAMQIEVEYTKAFARAYAASRAHLLLIKLAAGEAGPPITIETRPLLGLIRHAMQKTARADHPLYARLPIPVRYRASGAIEAWRQVLEAAGPSGADFT